MTTEPDLIAWQRFYSIAGLWKRLKPQDFFYQGRNPLSAGRASDPPPGGGGGGE